jgi:hypothetical protein
MSSGLLMEFERGDLDHIFSLTCLSLKKDVESLGTYIAELLRKDISQTKIMVMLDSQRLMTLLFVLYSYSDRNDLVDFVQNSL